MKTLKFLAATASAAFLSVGAASAATIFSATIEEAQSTTPSPGFTNQFGQAALSLEQGEDGTFSLAISVTFAGDLDFSEIIGSGQIDNVIGEAGTTGGELVTGFHIHAAERGEAGPVVFSLFDTRIDALNGSSDTDGENTIEFGDDGSVIVSSIWDMGEGTDAGTLMNFIAELANADEGEDLGLYFNLHTAAAASGLIRGQVVAENSLNPVPVPAALPLFAGALVAGGAVRRKLKR